MTDVEHDMLRENLRRIDASLEKLANSMSTFAITMAQSEIRHEKSEQMYLRLERIQDVLTTRLDNLEVSITACQERAKPAGWLADKVGSVVITVIVSGLMTLIMIKGA